MIPTRRILLALFSYALLATRAFGLVTDEYQWSDFVGNVSGLGHADASGSNAQFLNPVGIATDSSGNVYVADTANNIIRMVTPAGNVSTVAGTAGVTGTADGVGSAAQFNAPAGITVTLNGLIYVADTGNNTIRRIAPDGTVTTIAGTPSLSGTDDGTGGAALFNAPSALAADVNGGIYVADTLNNTIRKVTYQGDVTTVAGEPRVTGTANGIGSAARFFHPAGIALDNANARFLIADTQNDTIRVLHYDGLVSTFAGTPRVSGSVGGAVGVGELNKPVGVVALQNGVIYVADSASDTIRQIYATGVIATEVYAGKTGVKGGVDGFGQSARFNDPMALAAGLSNTVDVADTGNSTIRSIDSRDVTTLAGSPTLGSSADGIGTGAGFDYPCGVALSGSNTVYIADTYNDTIRVATKEGVVTTFAGVPHLTGTTDGAGGIVRFFHPTGLVTDTNGNVYVADTDNDSIRMITPAGLVSTFAGTPGTSGTTNGAAATAQFNHPRGITLDGSNMYIADTGNDTIREISGGVVSTFAGIPTLSGTSDGASGIGQFDQPEGIVFVSGDGFYVADTQNQTIRFILPSGTVSTYAGSPHHRGSKDGVAKVARFDNPAGITADNHHRLFVADTGDDTIREIEPDLNAISTTTTIGGTAGLRGSAQGIGADANFAEPHGIVATPEHGVLYVADSLNNRVEKGVSTGGTLKVKLTPIGAVNAGAMWAIDGGGFTNASGAVIRNLTVGPHTITFKPVSNYGTPTSQIVNISAFATTVATGDYAQEFGSATVTIVPQAAINAGAQWKIEGRTPYNSGDTATGLTAGTHTVIFTSLPGFDRPASQTITVPVNGNVATTGTYNIRSGSLLVNLIPAGAVTAGAQWNVDGGSAQNGGAIVTGLSLGSHTVNFLAATGYTTPASQSVIIADQQTTTTTGTYGGIPVISLQQPVGTALVNNSSTVNFGPVVSGSTLSLQFAIVNAGTAPLTGLSLAIGGANADRFTTSSLTSGTLAIGGTSLFTVGCTPIGLGSVAGTLTVTSNDPVNPTFTVALAATGTNGPVTFKYGAGTYVGLLTGTNNTVRGYAALTLSAKGALTGKFYLDGVLTGPSTVVHGTFATDGQYTGTPSNVSMLLTGGSGGPSNPAGYQILSTATSLSGPVPYIAYHAAYTATQKVTENRKYTLLMSGTDTSATVPQGTSYATLTIPATGGAATLTGKLADGTPYTYSTHIASGPYGHQILVFDGSLYHSKGFFGGPLTFATMTDTNLAGIFQWVNPGGQSKILYPTGFNTLVDVAGATYLPPVRNTQPIPLSTGTFTVSGGGLPNPISEPIFLTVYPAEKVIITGNDGNPSSLKVTVNGAAGSFTGSFIHTVTGKSVSFSGLLYQNNNDPGAAGYFIGPSLIGNSPGTKTTGTALSGNVQLAP